MTSIAIIIAIINFSIFMFYINMLYIYWFISLNQVLITNSFQKQYRITICKYVYDILIIYSLYYLMYVFVFLVKYRFGVII